MSVNILALIIMTLAVTAAVSLDVWLYLGRRRAHERLDAVSTQLINERGGNHFKVARLQVDIDRLQARMRGEIYTGISVEASVVSNQGSFMVYADRPLDEAEANAVMAMLPMAERF